MSYDTLPRPPSEQQQWRQEFEIVPGCESKIDAIIEDGPRAAAFLFDFDGALTHKGLDGIGGTTWGVLRSNMPTPESRGQHAELFARYYPLHEAGTMSRRQSYHWQIKALRLLTGASIEDIQDDAAEQIVLRPGVTELFDASKEYDIPVFIKSTGATAIIRSVLQRHEITPAYIYANELTVEDGIVTGVLPEVVHYHNKHTFRHERHPLGEGRHNVLAIGDDLADALMILDDRGRTAANDTGDEIVWRALRIRQNGSRDRYIAGHTNGQAGWDNYVEKSFRGGYDMVSVREDLTAITGLAHAIGKQAA